MVKVAVPPEMLVAEILPELLTVPEAVPLPVSVQEVLANVMAVTPVALPEVLARASVPCETDVLPEEPYELLPLKTKVPEPDLIKPSTSLIVPEMMTRLPIAKVQGPALPASHEPLNVTPAVVPVIVKPRFSK